MSNSSQRNATSSWSGFSHQGKVGILVALVEINKLLSEDRPLEDWIMCQENVEDFDIKKGDEVKSRHQVKAYSEGNNLNDYADVLCEFETKINAKEIKKTVGFDMTGVPEGEAFLHTIIDVKGFGLSSEQYKLCQEKKKIK